MFLSRSPPPHLSLSWTAPQTGRTGAEMHSCETGGDTALCEKKGVILDKFDAILNRLGDMELSLKIENGQVRAHECWSLCQACCACALSSCVSVLLACMWCALLFALKLAFERHTRGTE